MAFIQGFAVAEAYPQLQASQNFSELQKELADTESKIAFARQFYNDTTMKFNTSIQTFPANIFAGMLGFTFSAGCYWWRYCP